LEGRLIRALLLRNWLAHDYFWLRSADAMSPTGRARMIAELKEAGEFLESVDEELTAVTETWLESAGVHREVIEAEIEGFLAQARAGGALEAEGS
jgi:hypothetical protein